MRLKYYCYPTPRTRFLFLLFLFYSSLPFSPVLCTPVQNCQDFHPLLLSPLFHQQPLWLYWDSCGRLISSAGIVYTTSSSRKCSWLSIKGWIRESESSSASSPLLIPETAVVASNYPHLNPSSNSPQTKIPAGKQTPRSHVPAQSKFFCIPTYV